MSHLYKEPCAPAKECVYRVQGTGGGKVGSGQRWISPLVSGKASSAISAGRRGACEICRWMFRRAYRVKRDVRSHVEVEERLGRRPSTHLPRFLHICVSVRCFCLRPKAALRGSHPPPARGRGRATWSWWTWSSRVPRPRGQDVVLRWVPGAFAASPARAQAGFRSSKGRPLSLGPRRSQELRRIAARSGLVFQHRFPRGWPELRRCSGLCVSPWYRDRQG